LEQVASKARSRLADAPGNRRSSSAALKATRGAAIDVPVLASNNGAICPRSTPGGRSRS
jgi:hypothetical protein